MKPVNREGFAEYGELYSFRRDRADRYRQVTPRQIPGYVVELELFVEPRPHRSVDWAFLVTVFAIVVLALAGLFAHVLGVQ